MFTVSEHRKIMNKMQIEYIIKIFVHYAWVFTHGEHGEIMNIWFKVKENLKACK